MDLNDQFDENAADLSNIGAENPPEAADKPIAPVGNNQHNATKLEVVLAIAILIGFILIIYLFLQRPRSSFVPPPVLPPTAANGSSK